jgi:hypothetical protein
MELTREQAIKLFREHWAYLAKTGSDYKAGWIQQHFPREKIANQCFLCEYDKQQLTLICESCPIEWPGGCCETMNNGLYTQWRVLAIDRRIPECKRIALEISQCKIIALQISQLPEKELPCQI